MKNKLIVVLCLLLISCQNRTVRKDISISKLEINIKGFKHTLDISDFFDAVFIPLELTQESMIGDIDKVIEYDNFLYVLDSKKAKKLLVFNMEGKFIRTIGQLGKGNGEYLVLSDFDVVGDKIYISSQQDNRMLIFDLNGKHVKDIKFSGYIGMNFKVIENKGFIVKNTDGSNKSAIFYDIKGKVRRIFTNPGINFMRFSNPQAFFDFDKQHYMYFAMNDTIYKMDNEELIPKYFIDFGNKSIPYSKINNKEMLNEYLANKEYMRFMTFYTFNKYHFATVFNSEYPYSLIINKLNEDIYYANILNFKGFPIHEPVGYSEQGPIFLWGPPSIPIYDNILEDKSRYVPECFKNASINSNPGIVILVEK